jgi:DNA-binding response OmpR family regulator
MTGSNKRILVVDDNMDAAVLMAEILRTEMPERFSVTVAFNGRQALEAAAVQIPDTVVMDIEMPVMTGFEAALEFRAGIGTARTHLIAMSGRTDYIDNVLRMETAFDVGLVKPVDFDELVKLIDGGLESDSGDGAGRSIAAKGET